VRTLAVGDIHGCSKALDVLLANVQLQTGDLLVTLGDYVDRGPDSSGVIQRLLRFRKYHRLVALRGNHELMMLAARHDEKHLQEWLKCGGREALSSYSELGDAGKLADVPDEHWEFIERRCVDWYETDHHFFVHANAYPELPLAEQPAWMLFWEPINNPAPHESGKPMICGHSPQKNGNPLNLGHAICIDTWAHGNGWLTCFDVVSGKVWQANQAGQSKTGWIEDIN
jgi:serine/threonine protein phosphatase 1